MKYRYEILGNKVTAYCKYAGKEIKASATCHSEDKFDANVGMQIAAARLDLKLQRKRFKRAQTIYSQAVNLKAYAEKLEEDRRTYLIEMSDNLSVMERDYEKLINKLS